MTPGNVQGWGVVLVRAGSVRTDTEAGADHLFRELEARGYSSTFLIKSIFLKYRFPLPKLALHQTPCSPP